MPEQEMTLNRTFRHITILALSALGELIMTLPLVQETRRLYPEARLTLICERPAVAELAETLQIAETVIRLPNNARGLPSGPFRSWWAVHGLQTDLAFQPFTSHGSFGNLIIHALNAPTSCGYGDGLLRNSLTHRLDIPQDRHHIVLNLDLLRRLGHEDVREPNEPFLPLWDARWEKSVSRDLKIPTGPYVLMACASDAKLTFKRWDKQKWASLCARLTAQGLACVFTGMKDDWATIEDIRHRAGGHGCNIAGKTSMADLARLIRGCELVIGTDGMTLHLAAATHTPCVGIFGPTDPLHVGPMGGIHRIVRLRLPCMPCYGPGTVGKAISCRTHECLHHLPVERVYEAALAILNRDERAALTNGGIFADTKMTSDRGQHA